MTDAIHLVERWAAGASDDVAARVGALVVRALGDDPALRLLLTQAASNAVTDRTRQRAQLALADAIDDDPVLSRELATAMRPTGSTAIGASGLSVAPSQLLHGAVVDDDVDVVKHLFFGRDDAEHDLANGLLRQGFLPTSAYSEVVSGRKNLIIGRKGAGKSAICMRLVESAPGSARLITPDDAAGEELRCFALDGLTPPAAKALIWRYVFAVHAARQLVEHAAARRRPASIAMLDRFLRDNGELAEESLYHRVARAGRGLTSSFSLEAFGVKLTADGSPTPAGVRASRQLDVLESGVRRGLEDLDHLRGRGPLLVAVDQVEQVWSRDPDTEALVVGLLLAGKHITLRYGGSLRCVVFLRSDIYDSLEFSDADKFHSDEIRLSWTPHMLRELALTRAGLALGRPLTPGELWGEVFPEFVAGEPTAEYLLTRTLPRPRDAIQFLNQCRDVALANGHRRISERDVLDATVVFSRWKLLDLSKEYGVRLPFLGTVLAAFRGAGYEQTRESIAELLLPLQDQLHRDHGPYRDFFDPDVLIELLFAVGFLGVRRAGSEVYAGTAEASPTPRDSTFCLHPCFRPALGATQRRTVTVVNRVTGNIVNDVVQIGGMGQLIQGGSDVRFLDLPPDYKDD